MEHPATALAHALVLKVEALSWCEALIYSGRRPRRSQPRCTKDGGSGGRGHLCRCCPQALSFIHFCAFSPAELTTGDPAVQIPAHPLASYTAAGE